MSRNPFVCLALLVLLGGCASGGGDELVADPYEGFNRRVHSLNTALDSSVLRPLADGYDAVTPTLVKHLFGNFSAHLKLPGVFANRVLQGEETEAAATFGRFAVNTIYGAGGLLDPATEFGLPYTATDFGATLASWGVGEGAYFELPLFGPTTSRDGWARIVDYALAPTTYVTGGLAPVLGALGFQAVEIVDARDANRVIIDDLLYAQEDSYIAVRSTYIQNRRRQLGGDAAAGAASPDIFAQ